jgi:hypothetical protein
MVRRLSLRKESEYGEIQTDDAQAPTQTKARRSQGQLVHGAGPRQKVIHPPSPQKRGGRASRRKGVRGELALVRFLQARGFAAEKSSRTGYRGPDLSVPLLGRDLKCEVKVRRNTHARARSTPVQSFVKSLETASRMDSRT